MHKTFLQPSSVDPFYVVGPTDICLQCPCHCPALAESVLSGDVNLKSSSANVLTASQNRVITLRALIIDELHRNSSPLPSSRHRRSYLDCLEDKRENYQNRSVLCCERQLYTMIRTHMSSSYSWLSVY